MDLAIIGAGESTRIKAEGLTIPKHLVKINSEYLIERIIRIGRECGMQKVHCIINEQEPELKSFLLSKPLGVPLNLIIQNTQSSMHSLFTLAPFLSQEPFCLATVDSVFAKIEFAELIDYSLVHNDVDGTLAVTKYIDDEKPLCVAMDEEDTIFRFSDSKEGYNWATGGIYYFSPRIFEEMSYALENGVSRLRNFLRHLVARGYLLKGFSFSKIIDVDHLSDIEKAESFIKGIE